MDVRLQMVHDNTSMPRSNVRVMFANLRHMLGTTSSRTLWAISRDGALPYSKFWMRISKRWLMPVNAMCLSATMASVSKIVRLKDEVG